MRRRIALDQIMLGADGDATVKINSCAGGKLSGDNCHNRPCAISDEIKEFRFLWAYPGADGSLGIHSPDYVEAMRDEAERVLDGLGK